MVFFRRTPRGHDRWLGAKIILLGIAGVVFLLAVRLELRWLVWVAVGLLLAGFLMRFLHREAHDDEAAGDS